MPRMSRVPRVANRAAVVRRFGVVELIVAAVVLAGLALLTAPRWGNAAEPPAKPEIRLQLEILRNAIERYAYDHGAWPAERSDGVHPAETYEAFLAQLTQCTDRAGAVGPCGERFCFGPYLDELLPACPLAPDGAAVRVHVVADGAAPAFAPEAQACHWVYCPRTGQIAANTDAVDSAGRRYDRY